MRISPSETLWCDSLGDEPGTVRWKEGERRDQILLFDPQRVERKRIEYQTMGDCKLCKKEDYSGFTVITSTRFPTFQRHMKINTQENGRNMFKITIHRQN